MFAQCVFCWLEAHRLLQSLAGTGTLVKDAVEQKMHWVPLVPPHGGCSWLYEVTVGAVSLGTLQAFPCSRCHPPLLCTTLSHCFPLSYPPPFLFLQACWMLLSLKSDYLM